MAKYTEEFKQQVLQEISNEGHIPVIKRYWDQQGIRPETIRYWMRPEKAKQAAQKALEYYYKNASNPEFLKHRRQLTEINQLQSVYLDYSYTQKEQKREWHRIQKSPGNYKDVVHLNKIVLSNQPHFFDKERELFKDKHIRDKLLANRLKYIGKQRQDLTMREILRGFKISGIYTGFSHFSPLWIKAFIEQYKPKIIYDPCGGWGHRLLGALSTDTPYIYNDFWDKTFEGDIVLVAVGRKPRAPGEGF